MSPSSGRLGLVLAPLAPRGAGWGPWEREALPVGFQAAQEGERGIRELGKQCQGRRALESLSLPPLPIQVPPALNSSAV